MFQGMDLLVDYLEGKLGTPVVDDVIKWNGTGFEVGAVAVACKDQNITDAYCEFHVQRVT